ncbi:hypothetical protein Dimus_039381 [Dionaea muscipula]
MRRPLFTPVWCAMAVHTRRKQERKSEETRGRREGKIWKSFTILANPFHLMLGGLLALDLSINTSWLSGVLHLAEGSQEGNKETPSKGAKEKEEEEEGKLEDFDDFSIFSSS